MTLSFAFPRERRLLKTDEFSSVFRFKCGEKGVHFRILAKPNGLPCARLGVVVPKKVLPLAVNRNRVKRLIRESFRRYQLVLSGLDVIVQLHAPLSTQAETDPVKELQILIEKVQRCLASS